ncbi:hypothetical protein [Bdellovibrio svalbardensis]|uniref:Uncharacterized protein n=1 Tax=Bdellovibrio svalbardensis TaxID=2972972 RepID=A0ABT6DQF8_9BACT|nr:hypothetical protein [Bdellovibrio svalbardensis]MDG0818149.1 hypothetical protein [Bdellovibrio svalbardensis]
MKKHFALLVLFLFATKVCLAGDVKRNGGDVLLCDGTYSSFDLYEGEVSYGYKIDLPSDGTYQQIAQKIISRIGKNNPLRQNMYLQQLQDFTSESRFVPSANFTAIPDIGDGVPVPKNCNMVQVVAQFRQSDPQGKRYLINQDVWSALREQDKAVLVLHEIIYREAFLDNPRIQSSVGVRHFAAYLSSTMMEQGTYRDYIKALSFSGLQKAEYKSLTFLLNSGLLENNQITQFPVEFSESGNLLKATLGTSVSLPYLDEIVSCTAGNSADAIKMILKGDKIAIISTCPMLVTMQSGAIIGSATSHMIVLRESDSRPFFFVFGNGPDFEPYRFHLSSESFFIDANPRSYGAVYWDETGRISNLDIIFEGFSKDGLSDNVLTVDGHQVPLKTKNGSSLGQRYSFTFDTNERIHWKLHH